MSQYIDKIVYINLNKRTDRKEQLESQLNAFDLNYERFEAIETPGFGILGCGYSHLGVLRLARDRGYKNILILEDDFEFLVSKEEFEENLTKFFETKIEYNVCMLSYNLQQHELTNFDFLLKMLEVQSASGYIVNANYYDKLIDLYEWALPLLEQTKEHWIYANDQIWKKYQKQDLWYCFKTRIGKQIDGFSDNANCFMSYEC
jgi:GR25 family glycosyltransferase involved in LPS biosynthesis